MLFHIRPDASDFAHAEAVVPFQFDWIEPELRPLRISLDVHMGRFVLVTRKEEEPVRPGTQNSRGHVLRILPSSTAERRNKEPPNVGFQQRRSRS